MKYCRNASCSLACKCFSLSFYLPTSTRKCKEKRHCIWGYLWYSVPEESKNATKGTNSSSECFLCNARGEGKANIGRFSTRLTGVSINHSSRVGEDRQRICGWKLKRLTAIIVVGSREWLWCQVRGKTIAILLRRHQRPMLRTLRFGKVSRVAPQVEAWVRHNTRKSQILQRLPLLGDVFSNTVSISGGGRLGTSAQADPGRRYYTATGVEEIQNYLTRTKNRTGSVTIGVSYMSVRIGYYGRGRTSDSPDLYNEGRWLV